MNEETIHHTQHAIVLSLDYDISEISELASSLDYSVIHSFIQHRVNPDVNSYLGSGKVEEVKEYLEQREDPISIVIVDGELKPSQWFNLEKTLEITVYDRIRLILAIFKERADRKEARLQVRLAELEYEKPYVRELIHRARSGEHPGLMAGGEYQVDDYYEMIKKQMKHIKEELSNIRQDRLVQRRHRKISGYYLVSLVGYTNAGKSSLLNQLSNEQITVEDRLFSTLSTTTRRIESKLPILLTDTVGFIQRLPSCIIDAFHSTLEEISTSDLILLICDGSDEYELLRKKIETSFQELADLEVTANVLIVINKIDQQSNELTNEKIQKLQRNQKISKYTMVPISVTKNQNIDLLLDKIFTSLPDRITMNIILPNHDQVQSFISWLYEKTYVISITYESVISLSVDCNQKLYPKIREAIQRLNGNVIE